MMVNNKSKKGQEEKSKILSLYPRRAQEEMVGFAFIIIIVAVILLIFISFTLTQDSVEVESYEVESFMQAMLQYTSDCSDNLERLSVQKLIFRCKTRGKCIDGRNSCDALNTTLNEMLRESWKIENTPIAGYKLKIVSEEKDMLIVQDGNETRNFKGSTQILPREIIVSFNAYY